MSIIWQSKNPRNKTGIRTVLLQARLQHADADQINALSVLALNLLKGNIPMSHCTKK